MCPVKAIRVAERRSRVIPERCVMCGECVDSCGTSGHIVRDDLPRVHELLDSGRPVVAVLATESRAAMHPMSPEAVEWTLLDTGFHGVETTLLGEEIVAAAYERLCAGTGGTVLRSTCPVAVAWVRRYHPSLVGLLAPVVPPYIAQARLVKEFYPDDPAIVYVSPCYARKEDGADPSLGGAVDVVIDFAELKHLLAWPEVRMPVGQLEGRGRRAELHKTISLTDGFPRSMLEQRDMTARDVVRVRGAGPIEALLQAVERGEAGPLVADLLYCDGCLEGPAVGSELSYYAKRDLFEADRGQADRPVVETRSLLEYLPPVDLARAFTPDPAPARVFPDAEIDACLAEGGFPDRANVLDCGACGYTTCVEHAAAVLAGDSGWDMCFPLERKRLERRSAELEESAAKDVLTGLWNRGVFTERLGNEFARYQRYGTPFTLLMIDLDGFKELNDGYGHTTGDAVLRSVADVMRDTLRETDVPARYGGDEFGLILPGVGTSAGYAVAEKLRSAVASRRIAAADPERTGEVSVTISVGLASTGPGISGPGELLEAADRALYRAKEQGRDRVMIAPD